MNVDFSRSRLHTGMLSSFCECLALCPSVSLPQCDIDLHIISLCNVLVLLIICSFLKP